MQRYCIIFFNQPVCMVQWTPEQLIKRPFKKNV